MTECPKCLSLAYPSLIRRRASFAFRNSGKKVRNPLDGSDLAMSSGCRSIHPVPDSITSLMRHLSGILRPGASARKLQVNHETGVVTRAQLAIQDTVRSVVANVDCRDACTEFRDDGAPQCDTRIIHATGTACFESQSSRGHRLPPFAA